MARLQTVGFEGRQRGNLAGADESPGVTIATAGTINTSTPRSGSACYSANASGANALVTTSDQGAAFATDVAYFARMGIRSNSNPTVRSQVLFATVNSVVIGVHLDTDGTLKLFNNASQVGSASSVVSGGSWHYVEFSILVPAVGDGTLAMRLDGSDVVAATTATVGNVAPTSFTFGRGASGDAAILIDDLALNDSQGPDQATWPGDGKVIHLLPVSDNARGNWTVGGGGTTNLWDAVDNVPPAGVAGASATSTSQIRNTVASSSAYDTNITDYSTAGLDGTVSITLVQAHMHWGRTTGGLNGGVKAVSNPADSGEVVTASPTSNVGTSPSNWKAQRGNVVYAPSVTLGTNPVVRAGKRSSTTSAMEVDNMALVVEYAPIIIIPTPPARVYTVQNAVKRSFNW